MNINDRIKEIVASDYKSQSALAKELDVSRVTIGSYVNDDSKPNTEILQKFYNLGYNMNWLISGNGSKNRYLLNNEELDDYDKLVFFLDDKIYKSYGSKLGKNTVGVIKSPKVSKENLDSKIDNDLDEQISNDIRIYYYLRNSYIFLERKLYESSYTRFIKESLAGFSGTYDFDLRISQKLEELVENNIELKDHTPIKIEINKNIDLNKFSHNLATFIFLLTELNYYKNSIKQYQVDVSFQVMQHLHQFLPEGHILKNEPYIEKISFEELKNRFKHIFNIFENESYIGSKSLFFAGLVDNIFKIEQSEIIK